MGRESERVRGKWEDLGEGRREALPSLQFPIPPTFSLPYTFPTPSLPSPLPYPLPVYACCAGWILSCTGQLPKVGSPF